MNKPTKGAIIRTFALFVALVNQLLVAYGASPLPFAEQDVELFVSTMITVVTGLIAWWKNNSFTKKAIEADKKVK